MKTRDILSGAGLLVAILAGSGIATATPTETQVAVQVFQFRPAQLDVKAGTRVTWTNGDEITHTVTSGAPGQNDVRFSGRLDGKGTTFAHTFGDPGTYQCHCERHQAMTGEIVVK